MLKIDRFTVAHSATLEFQAISNKTYTDHYSEHLEGNQWSKLADIVGRATHCTEAVTDSATVTNRYYRLVTPRQP